MSAIITVIVTFIFTGVIGNRLIHAWQFRNWIKQQRFLGAEKEFFALKELSEEIVELSSRRLNKMQRLLSGLRLKNEVFEIRFSEYDEILSNWNERLPSFYVRLTMLSTYDFTLDLEGIHQYFVNAGRKLEALVRVRRREGQVEAKSIEELAALLNGIQASMFEFNRELLRSVQRAQEIAYVGVETRFGPETVNLFSNWQLFKAVFVPIEKVPSIYRTAMDTPKPSFGW